MILVIGEAPGAKGTRDMVEALYQKTGVLLEDAAHRNLLGEWPGREGKGSAFPLEHARARARRFRIRKDVGTVVLLGKRLAAAFGLDVNYFEPALRNSRRWVVVPHPSGVNTWWNDVENRVRAMRFLEALQ